MPFIDLRCFRDEILDDARDLIDVIEELERYRNDVRTTNLLVSARQFLGTVEIYFEREQARRP